MGRTMVGSKNSKWYCRCECGREGTVLGQSLVRGLSRSCGCLQRDIRPSNAERFAACLSAPTPNGCIEWRGTLSPKGYGLFSRIDAKPRIARAHRLAWEMANGTIPEGLRVLHKCDNPPCVNVEHLFLGTDADNTHDAMRKGRLKPFPVRADNRGSRNGQAKLNEENVAVIRRALERGITRREISEFYRISRAVVDGIAWRTLWKHVP